MAEPAFTWTHEVRPVCQVGTGDTQTAEPVSWQDVSCYVHEAELFVGRDRFNDRFQVGTASITFSNEDGWADLFGASGPAVAARALRPGRPIRIGVHGPWADTAPTVRWLWRGWIDQTTPAYDPVDHDFVTANCIDAFGEAGSATAPNGPFQGANELASARINRVLDAVGWFPAKRKIGTTTTAVQGTELGSGGIDLMGQAADSDGGVVYGDVDGDVVFRNRDWMLYDPDDPPDGTIGNVDPGTVIPPFTPPYIDPEQGYVYEPAPPPFDVPTVVKVCFNGSNGTLIEQGDSFRLYVGDSQLYFMSSGHLYDLGAVLPGNQCTGVIFDPNPADGDSPVERIQPVDDNGVDPEGEWVPWPDPPVEIDVPFTAELLGYSQGCFADGGQTGFTIGPVTADPGCLLVMLVVAICETDAEVMIFTDIDLGSITGGGTWGTAFRSSSGYRGSEAGGYFAETDRLGPSTFTVTAVWASGPATSKYHIATLWQISEYRSDLPARMAQAAFRFGRDRGYDMDGYPPPFTPASPSPPGNGFHQFPIWDNRVDIPTFTQPSDIVLAQSLAESPNSPWGAVFNETDGAWEEIDTTADPPCSSWVAGSRTGAGSHEVMLNDVNTGPDDIVSGQAAVVMESGAAAGFGWYVTYYDIVAQPSTTLPSGGTRFGGIIAEPNSIVVVFVGVMFGADIAAEISVTSDDLTFLNAHTQIWGSIGHAQGAAFWAKMPAEPFPPDHDVEYRITWGAHAIDKLTHVAYVITNADAVVAHAGAVRGLHVQGSITGGLTLVLDAPPAASSVVLGFLNVAGEEVNESGAVAGTGWHEELQYMPGAQTGDLAYFQTQSRTGSTDDTVIWDEMVTGLVGASDAVALAVEITPGPDFLMWQTTQPLEIGGARDAFNGPIYYAARWDDNTPSPAGDPVWVFDPSVPI